MLEYMFKPAYPPNSPALRSATVSNAFEGSMVSEGFRSICLLQAARDSAITAAAIYVWNCFFMLVLCAV